MLVLGLDPSLTEFGWALHDTEADAERRVVKRGRFQTRLKDFPDEIKRYRFLRETLKKKIQETQPDAMGIEHPVFKEIYSEGMYALFMFCLDAIESSSQDLVLFAPPQIKRFAKDILGRPKGWKMGKSDMIEAAQEDVPKSGRWNHNEADAYLVARFSGRFWSFLHKQIDEDALTSYEKKTFTEIRTIKRGKRAGSVEVKGILHREGNRFFRWSCKESSKLWPRKQPKK